MVIIIFNFSEFCSSCTLSKWQKRTYYQSMEVREGRDVVEFEDAYKQEVAKLTNEI